MGVHTGVFSGVIYSNKVYRTGRYKPDHIRKKKLAALRRKQRKEDIEILEFFIILAMSGFLEQQEETEEKT